MDLQHYGCNIVIGFSLAVDALCVDLRLGLVSINADACSFLAATLLDYLGTMVVTLAIRAIICIASFIVMPL